MTAPCGWTVTGCLCGTDKWSDYPAATQAYAESVAALVLWAATGRKYGQCEMTVRPCIRPVEPLYVDYPVETTGLGPEYQTAYILDGEWHNSLCGPACSCGGCCEVELTGPTSTDAITSVTVDGVVIADTAYEINDGYLLVRTDGLCWPVCTGCCSADVPFEVVYSVGSPIPAALQAAYERYACEIARSCTGASCALPNRVRSITRQGIEVQLADVTDGSGKIRTGIPDVDQVIVSLNPYGAVQQPGVWTPDLPAPRVVT